MSFGRSEGKHVKNVDIFDGFVVDFWWGFGRSEGKHVKNVEILDGFLVDFWSFLVVLKVSM